jgi:N-acetylmuramoyl-L-alanine amidase
MAWGLFFFQMKKWRFFGTLTLVLFAALAPSRAQTSPSKETFSTVVIDAGHGGRDPGCVGLKYQEKNITLSLALKLGSLIQERLPGIKVVYTRSSDVFVPLDDRAKIANDHRADLFISIHCNAIASHKESVYGAETYVMGKHVLEENLEVAKRENAVVLHEEGFAQQYDGYDPDSPIGHIVLSMFQGAYQERSLSFAALLDKQVVALTKRKTRGVHQAGFLVLRKTVMPGILFEAGYLSNPKEELILGSEEGQQKIAEALFEAVRQFKAQTEGRAVPAAANKPTVQADPAPAPTEKAAVPVQWYIQLASSELPLSTGEGIWTEVPMLKTERINRYYAYLIGPHQTYESAMDGQQYWRKKGFPDAFLVPYQNGERVPFTDNLRP